MREIKKTAVLNSHQHCRLAVGPLRLISTIQHSVSFSTVSLSCIPWAVFPHCLCVLRSSVRFVASYWPDGKIKGAYTASPFALLRTRKYMWFVGKCPENIQ